MALYSFNAHSWTPVATNDTSALADNTHMAIKGASATQIIRYVEIVMGGENSASAINIMVFSRDSTVGSTLTGLTTKQSYAAMNFASAAPTAGAFVAATTKPQRDVARHLLDFSWNSFGGFVRWAAQPGEEPFQVGNTASGGECSLSGFTGATAGPISAHFIVEEV